MQPDDDATSIGEAPPDAPDDLPVCRDDSSTRKLKRRAGCIWGCLTEPLLILGVTLLAAVLGRTYLVRRARRLRQQARNAEPRE
ncbi:MAG: hypothetical protein KBI47_11975 [Armatimonadetes bacterium]|nr:hypothetical protein [Armatimonadota bacterium]MDI9582661.1 hypothetical protein [Acidobacteriota bacterium]